MSRDDELSKVEVRHLMEQTDEGLQILVDNGAKVGANIAEAARMMLNARTPRPTRAEAFMDVHDARREVAAAWWGVVNVGGAYGDVEDVLGVCEGCQAPAFHRDGHGVELCTPCMDNLVDEARAQGANGLQPGELRAVCDGDHPFPACSSPECWHGPPKEAQ